MGDELEKAGLSRRAASDDPFDALPAEVWHNSRINGQGAVIGIVKQ